MLRPHYSVRPTRSTLSVGDAQPAGSGFVFPLESFDSVLQQKEYFSSYVFEETAAELLESNPTLKAASIRPSGTEGGKPSARAQLDFIYQRSPHSEGTAGRYPIYRPRRTTPSVR